MPVELASCVLCFAPQSAFQLYERVRGWSYVRCSGCGLVFLNPQPTGSELHHFYNHSYRYDFKRYAESIPRQEIWLDLLEEICGEPGALLEVGCSYGHFLAQAKERGWKARGVELSESAVEFGRSTLGLPIEPGRIMDVRDRAESSFDAIAAWHVLEHDPFPRQFVATASALLRPGGILALRVPNLGSAVAKLSGPDWQWLSPPEHVCMYTQATLSLLLQRTGFEIVEVRSARGNARNMWFEILRARAKQSLRRGRNGGTTNNEARSFAPPAVYQDQLWYRISEGVAAAGTLPLDWAFSRWLAGTGREAELAVFARKPASHVDARALPESEFEAATL